MIIVDKFAYSIILIIFAFTIRVQANAVWILFLLYRYLNKLQLWHRFHITQKKD